MRLPLFLLLLLLLPLARPVAAGAPGFLSPLCNYRGHYNASTGLCECVDTLAVDPDLMDPANNCTAPGGSDLRPKNRTFIVSRSTASCTPCAASHILGFWRPSAQSPALGHYGTGTVPALCNSCWLPPAPSPELYGPPPQSIIVTYSSEGYTLPCSRFFFSEVNALFAYQFALGPNPEYETAVEALVGPAPGLLGTFDPLALAASNDVPFLECAGHGTFNFSGEAGWCEPDPGWAPGYTGQLDYYGNAVAQPISCDGGFGPPPPWAPYLSALPGSFHSPPPYCYAVYTPDPGMEAAYNSPFGSLEQNLFGAARRSLLAGFFGPAPTPAPDSARRSLLAGERLLCGGHGEWDADRRACVCHFNETAGYWRLVDFRSAQEQLVRTPGTALYTYQTVPYTVQSCVACASSYAPSPSGPCTLAGSPFPTLSPTTAPSTSPTVSPTNAPTTAPTSSPTTASTILFDIGIGTGARFAGSYTAFRTACEASVFHSAMQCSASYPFVYFNATHTFDLPSYTTVLAGAPVTGPNGFQLGSSWADFGAPPIPRPMLHAGIGNLTTPFDAANYVTGDVIPPTAIQQLRILFWSGAGGTDRCNDWTSDSAAVSGDFNTLYLTDWSLGQAPCNIELTYLCACAGGSPLGEENVLVPFLTNLTEGDFAAASGGLPPYAVADAACQARTAHTNLAGSASIALICDANSNFAERLASLLQDTSVLSDQDVLRTASIRTPFGVSHEPAFWSLFSIFETITNPLYTAGFTNLINYAAWMGCQSDGDRTILSSQRCDNWNDTSPQTANYFFWGVGPTTTSEAFGRDTPYPCSGFNPLPIICVSINPQRYANVFKVYSAGTECPYDASQSITVSNQVFAAPGFDEAQCVASTVLGGKDGYGTDLLTFVTISLALGTSPLPHVFRKDGITEIGPPERVLDASVGVSSAWLSHRFLSAADQAGDPYYWSLSDATGTFTPTGCPSTNCEAVAGTPVYGSANALNSPLHIVAGTGTTCNTTHHVLGICSAFVDRPTSSPTVSPTAAPTTSPTVNPTHAPSVSPTHNPTNNPTQTPTANPTTAPTHNPTHNPTSAPTRSPSLPTNSPTNSPTNNPTNAPTNNPTNNPTNAPTNTPTASPSVLSMVLWDVHDATGSNPQDKTTADAICAGGWGHTAFAATNSYALISFSGTEEIRDLPTTHGFSTSIPVYGPNGDQLASSWSSLLSTGTLKPALNTGIVPTDTVTLRWWSGSTSAGVYSTPACVSGTAWKSASSGVSGRNGYLDVSGTTWMDEGTQTCDNSRVVMCLSIGAVLPPTQQVIIYAVSVSNGNLGGLSGADSKCTADSQYSSLSCSSAIAMVSSSATTFSSRFAAQLDSVSGWASSNLPRLATIVGPTGTAMTDTSATHLKAGSGNTFTAFYTVTGISSGQTIYTGTRRQWDAAAVTCSDWTSASAGVTGAAGTSSATYGAQLFWDTSPTCDTAGYIACLCFGGTPTP